jgi:hypothetical protein
LTPIVVRRNFEWLQQIGLSKTDLRGCGRWTNSCKGKRVLVVGSARCVWDDLAAFGPIGRYEVMAINDAIMHFPIVHHAFSHDRKWLPRWLEARRPRYVQVGEPIAAHTVMDRCVGLSATIWPWQGIGTSALGAVLTALAMGYDRIVILGVPLDNSGHYFDPLPGTNFGPMTKYIGTNFETAVPPQNGKVRYWSELKAAGVLDDRIRSMSGRTRDVLGAP